jgi:hypothetical protein
MRKNDQGLNSYEWIAALSILLFIAILCVIAWNAPENRWPKKQGIDIPSPKALITIYLSGAIKNPGRYHFEEGENLRECLQKIELSEDADIEKLALDKPLKRGQRIKIPKKKKKAKESI